MPITDNTPPPVKKAPSRAAVAKAKTESSLHERRVKELTGLGGFVQVPLIAFRQHADAGAVAQHWPNVAREIALLAGEYEQVAKLVDPLMQVGPFAGIITAVLPFLLQIGVNHNRIPAGAMGTVPASALATQIETALAQQELEALRTQYEAEQQARELRTEMDNARRAMADAMRDRQMAETGGK